MVKFLFDKCCFCIDLRIGCFIIGYLQMIGSAIGVIMTIIAISAAGVLTSSDDPDLRADGTTMLSLSIFNLLFLGGSFVFAIVLVVGMHKNKPGHVKAYLIYNVVFLVSFFVLLIVKVFDLPFNVLDFLSTMAGLVINVYMLLVIRSHYYRILEGNGDAHGRP